MAFQYGMLMQLSIMLLALLVATTRASARQGGEEDETAIALPGCKAKCGNVTIPYPFGIGDGCYFRHEFNITCNGSNPQLMTTPMIVTNISLEEGELQTRQLVNRDCYDRQGKPNDIEDPSEGGLRVYTPYTASSYKNRMYVIGCDTYAKLYGSRGYQNYITGCISECDYDISINAFDEDDPCSGMGCCETKIPPLLTNLSVTVGSFKNHTLVWDFNPCGYAFVVQKGNFTFSNTSFQELRNTPRLPLILDWQIGETDCKYAMENGTYACKGNSICLDRPTGYICVCNPGFRGNPYLHDCQDTNECALNATLCENGKCINKDGNYTCDCDSGYQIVDNIKCIKVPDPKKYLKISLGASLGFLVLLVGIFWTFRNMREKKFLVIRKKYFEDNGGLLFREKLASIPRYAAKTFTEEQLKEATDNYHVSRKVGEGGYGIVYKGLLDKQLVAIKKPKPNPQIPATEPSVQEMIVLSQINHKNVVRLVGCCFETRTPILVYEFMGKGTLYERIHPENPENPENPKNPPLSLELRLQIASEAADALAYLHHSTSTSIIHGDVKTASILLDENFTAKLSDFGASILVSEDENQLSTSCQGTQGYLDPENTLTKKSDVYSFGVVLAELLTSSKPEEERNLVNVFVSKVESGVLAEILDQKMVEGHFETAKLAADLAIRCLKEKREENSPKKRKKREERPSMKEVAAELEGLVRTMEQHPSRG
ncbi:wall-associated receptor kinase 2-like [Prunus avium]|uniref:Wall-associated receptor kinase 2-like n=1 Tax=Prunus avium TaxID=42229 RepID=A0A6P5R7F1_PRUAV|nr:wall-associated receptor kinase 2-like [Prunus avium]